MKLTNSESMPELLSKREIEHVRLVQEPQIKMVPDPRAIGLLKELLEYSRVKTIGGWKKGRCRSCDVPHLQYRICPCPHHAALRLLSESGITVEGM